MKNILLILLLSVSCKSYTQQTIVPIRTFTDIPENAGYYMKDTNNELHTFVGTWMGTWNNKTLVITFNKVVNKYDETFKYNRDYIVGKFKTLDSNGNILFNNTSLSDNDAKIEGIGFQKITDKYTLSYTDSDICNIGGSVYITFANTAKTQLNFAFQQNSQLIDSRCYFYNWPVENLPQPLPKTNIVLTKQ